ncbi:MAG: TetR/AcrR family transcriptional regulator [Segniliparus sp.]|uniref:TetR/AcrR family transcriptional regulator n=1 Tax=Segniliparus sp. TaxID=2804064 RepID=UPI003F2D3558
MPRLTRSERQAQTRAELLQAAKARFLATGYAATTLEDIAEDAGYSKGAVYSNFPDKPTLCGEVLDLIHREKTAEVEAVLHGGETLDGRLSALTKWLDTSLGDIGWTMLEFEFVVLSRHDPRLAQKIVELRADAHRTIAVALRDAVADLGFDSDEASISKLLEDAADLVLSTGIGLSVQRAVDPSLATRKIADMTHDLIEFVTAQIEAESENTREAEARS